MAFLLIDDGMFEHEKIVSLRPADAVAHMRAMCWSARRGTDGHLPPAVIASLGISKQQAKRLVEAGVWETNGSAGSHVIHDFLDFNPPTDPEERKRWFSRRRQWKRRSALAAVDGLEGSWPEGEQRDGKRDKERDGMRDRKRDASVTDA